MSLKKTKRIDIKDFEGEYITIQSFSMGNGMRLQELAGEIPHTENEEGETVIDTNDVEANKAFKNIVMFIAEHFSEILVDWSMKDEKGDRLSRDKALQELDDYLVMLPIVTEALSFLLGADGKKERKSKPVKN